MVTKSDLVMQDTTTASARDATLLLARILLVVLFILFGWNKLVGFSGTIHQMTMMHLPLPTIAAAIAVIMEFFVGLAIAVGLLTRPLAFLLAIYTLATAFIGHHYWTMTGPQHAANMINFYKNISIIGGLLVLSVSGAGKYSLDRQ